MLCPISPVVGGLADQVGVDDHPCIKIGYREPTRAESREGSFILAESSRVFFGVMILDSGWLTKFKCFSCSILIGYQRRFVFGPSPQSSRVRLV